MPKIVTPLTEGAINSLKPKDRPFKRADGGGMYLLVTPSGARLWRFDYRFGASALMVAAVGSYVANDPCPILVLQPTQDDARDFMVSTIEPTLGASPATRGLLKQDKAKRDVLLNRRFPGGSLKCVAAASPRNLRRHTVRVLLMDEVDG